MAQVAHGFEHHGDGIYSAQKAAVTSISDEVDRQAQMLSFNHIFILMAIIFTLSVPLMMTVKSKRTQEAVVGGGD